MPLYSKSFHIPITLQQVAHAAVLFLVLASVFSAYQSLQHPVGVRQIQQLDRLARQQEYPSTQSLALALLREHDYISYGQYLKVMHAQQDEQRQANQLPALQLD